MVDKQWVHSFDPQLKWQNAAELACPNVAREENCGRTQGALRVMHVRFFSWNGLVLDYPVPVGTMVSGWYYCSLLQGKMFARISWNCWSMVLFCSGSVLGHGGVVTMSLLFRSCPMWLLVAGTRERTSVGEKDLKQKMVCLFTLSKQGRLQSCNWSFTM